MAEGGLFSTATNLLSTLTSFKGQGRAPIAESDIEKLESSVKTIQLVLLDAEKRQEGSAAVKGWIRLVRDALYDADDLFDEISTYEQNQPPEGSNMQNQVRKFFSSSNSVAQAYKFSARVKDLRKSFDLVAKEIKMFCFVPREREEQMSVGTVACPEELFRVVGRCEEKKDVLGFLLEEESSNEEKNVPIIAIVGIGGMGKTTLARLVHDSDRVQQNFEKKWWASVADKDGDIEILREICEAMTCKNTCRESNRDELMNRIRKSVGDAGKYLLVIDGARGADHKRWLERMSPLRDNCAVGSKMIVTTRSLTVAKAMGAAKTQTLSGLSEDDSWELFKMIATPEKKDDPSLGRVIASKCSGVPLAITRIASLLRKIRVEEWESFMTEELSKIELSSNVVMSALKLSYDRLPSHLKHCFAYCAIFPKDHAISKQKLLYLWIAQGYVSPDNQTVEEMGDEYFSQLLSASFFKEAGQDEAGEISHFKMHDLVHDLAQLVAGDDISVLTEHSNRGRSARHISITYDIFQSSGSETLSELVTMDQLRSFLFMSIGSPLTHQQWAKFQRLRALQLSDLSIEDVPHCIGDFKSLRYLNLSRNKFNSLPDSISKLFNLVALDISECRNLKAWPKNMRRLVKLRHLDFSQCPGLRQMPDGLGGLTYLQYLSDFKPGNDPSMFEALSRLTLKGKLRIDFSEFRVEDSDERCKLPTTVKMLSICGHSGACLPRWRHEQDAAIVYLELKDCESLTRLPDLRILPNLKTLVVDNIKGLEYVEEAETERDSLSGLRTTTSFPCLENVRLVRLPDLKGWSKTGKLVGRVVPRLKKLEIAECPGMVLWGDGNRGMEWDSLSGLNTLKISPMPTPESLPPCFQQRNVRVLEYSIPQPEPAPVEHGQTSNNDSVERSTNSQSHETSIA